MTFIGIEYDYNLLTSIDDDFVEWMVEHEVNYDDWCEFGNAIQEYKNTDRFLSHFFEGLKVEDCMVYWAHYSPYVNQKVKDFVEDM